MLNNFDKVEAIYKMQISLMITWVMLKKSEQKACSSKNRENIYEKLGYC